MALVRNQSFTPTTCDNKHSKLGQLKNSVFQGSVLAFLLNFYMFDLSTTIFRKFTYEDDPALLHSSENWKAFEGTFHLEIESQDVKHFWRIFRLKS